MESYPPSQQDGQSDLPSLMISSDSESPDVRDLSFSSLDSGVGVKDVDPLRNRYEVPLEPLLETVGDSNTSDKLPLVDNIGLAEGHRNDKHGHVTPQAESPQVRMRDARDRQEAARKYQLFAQRAASKQGYHPKGTNRVQSVSERFYDESCDQPQAAAAPELYISFDDNPHKTHTDQSKKIPGWVWFILTKSLGIKSRPEERTIFAKILYLTTLLLGLTFVASYTWQKVYDIVSVFTKSTVLTGSVEIVICVCWVSLTVYANKCAARLFSSKNFVRSVRLHSKTIFKVSAVGLITLLAIGFMTLNDYHAYQTFRDTHCLSVNLSTVVCKIVYPARVSFNVFGIIWNLLVAFVLLSVCRTHTVGIRRFIKELEMDGKKYEKFWRDKMSANSQKPPVDIDCQCLNKDLESDWFIWDDHLTATDILQDPDVLDPQLRRRTISRQSGNQSVQSGRDDRLAEQSINSEASADCNLNVHSHTKALDDAEKNPNEESYSHLDEAPIMTNEDILLCYWKISCRMRVTSVCLQRWLSSWIIFVVLWCGNYVIYWTSHDATVIGIAEFLIPLLMIPLLASAYAEANTEGQRMIRSICPVEDRLGLLFYLGQQPLQMTVFNFPVTYQGIVGVIAAFSVAFASRIILDEVLVK